MLCYCVNWIHFPSLSSPIIGIPEWDGIAHYAKGSYDDALQVFVENTFTAKAINDHKLIVALLNNIGSTYFAQEKIDRSLDAFFEALEVQRSYLIKYFGGQPQQEEMAAGLTREMGAVLTTMLQTLNNLAYVHDYGWWIFVVLFLGYSFLNWKDLQYKCILINMWNNRTNSRNVICCLGR